MMRAAAWILPGAVVALAGAPRVLPVQVPVERSRTALPPSGAVPAAAARVGYVDNTLHSVFAPSSVDTADSRRPGFAWYLGRFFGRPPTPRDDLTLDSTGGVTLDGGTISSAAPTTTGAHWVGVAYGGGGYFEATLRFDPATVRAAGRRPAWPAWWGMAVEHMAQLPAQQWNGQPPGFAHFAEVDFFEYDIWRFAPANGYGGAVHDWYGVYDETCPRGYCGVSNAGGGHTRFHDFVVATPAHTDLRRFHRYGLLWVPATDSTRGYAQYFFDGKATTDTISWTRYAGQPPPPGGAPWTFGILDQQHLVLILDTGSGMPMTVASVDVWQASGKKNLSEH